MIYPWKLKYWQTGEWQVVNERLTDMGKRHETYNPIRSSLFKVLQTIRPEDVSVAIIGQDPYPQLRYTTGIAFSIPKDIEAKDYPSTLNTIFREYSSDLGYSLPNRGDLSRWIEQGVLLWNAIPSCREGQSLSHDWDEWSYLTREVITKLSTKGGVVFVFLGAVARRYVGDVDITRNSVVTTSHPSPRGSLNSRSPFLGSRIFTTINSRLADLGKPPINWRLDDAKAEVDPSQT